MRHQFLYSLLLAFAAFSLTSSALTTAKDKPQKRAANKDVKVERARREVRMLDDIYKGGIVAITTHYVNDKDTIPAGTAFKQIFKAAEEKGWHKVRLVDATGEPLNDENSPEDAFEKEAITKLLKGDPTVETIETRQGKRHLRVLTAVPVVFEKCIMCHDNYSKAKKGQAIGALSYTVPIDGKLIANRDSKAPNK